MVATNTQYKKVYEFAVLHQGWELDDTGWMAISPTGKPLIILTNHGQEYVASLSEIGEKIEEYKEALEESEFLLRTIKELDPSFVPHGYCCDTFADVVTASCELHGDNCPDRLIRKYGYRYGIPYRDCSASFSHIKFCPYCAAKL